MKLSSRTDDQSGTNVSISIGFALKLRIAARTIELWEYWSRQNFQGGASATEKLPTEQLEIQHMPMEYIIPGCITCTTIFPD
jgi:hypothetical protein